MGLYLDASARRRLVAAQRAMLAPLAYGDTEAWALAVNRAIRNLLGADHTVAYIAEEGGFDHVTDDSDPEPLRLIQDLFAGYDEAGFARFARWEDDPHASQAIELAHRVRRASGSGTSHDWHPEASHLLKRSDLWQATHGRAGHRHILGISAPLPTGEVATLVAFERSDAKGYREESVDVLELLVPAYEAGVRAWRRLGGFRESLDAVGEPIGVFDPEGNALFESQALGALLADEPQAAMVLEAMGREARRLLPWRPRRSRKSAREAQRVHEVATERASYQFRSSPMRPVTFGVEAALVLVQREGPVLPSAVELKKQFGLTARQAEVALLIAEGLDNRAVAERLFISPHTARRHTERVLRKLGVGSRSAVAVSLLQGVAQLR